MLLGRQRIAVPIGKATIALRFTRLEPLGKGWCGPASARQLWLVLLTASIVSFNLLPGELASNWPCLAAHSYSINSSAKAREAYNRDIIVVLETGHTGSTIEGRIQN